MRNVALWFGCCCCLYSGLSPQNIFLAIDLIVNLLKGGTPAVKFIICPINPLLRNSISCRSWTSLMKGFKTSLWKMISHPSSQKTKFWVFRYFICNCDSLLEFHWEEEDSVMLNVRTGSKNVVSWRYPVLTLKYFLLQGFIYERCCGELIHFNGGR